MRTRTHIALAALLIVALVAIDRAYPAAAGFDEEEAQRREFAAYLSGLTDGARQGYLARVCTMRDLFSHPIARQETTK